MPLDGGDPQPLFRVKLAVKNDESTRRQRWVEVVTLAQPELALDVGEEFGEHRSVSAQHRRRRIR